jgi:hypothetical protein
MCFVPLLALILLGSVQVAPATQLPEQVRDRVQVFATCSGRFSAMAARARSFRDGDAREHERMRDTFDLLLAARDKRQRRAQVQLSRRLDGCRALLL